MQVPRMETVWDSNVYTEESKAEALEYHTYMARRGFTTPQVAGKLGVSASTLRRWLEAKSMVSSSAVKFKVGDKVRLKEKVHSSVTSNFNRSMDKLKGTVLTISTVHDEEFEYGIVLEGSMWSWSKDWFILEESCKEQGMKKEDLRTGWLIVDNNGEVFKVLRGTTDRYSADIAVNKSGHGWLYFSNLEDTLEYERSREIVAIYRPRGNFVNIHTYDLALCDKVWERPVKIQEVTMADIEAKFGCKVKVVK